jgi:transglutaminase-like putative cysteine protease
MFNDGFSRDLSITYSAMMWLLVAQIAVMTPLMFYLPLWILPVLLFSAGWRIRVMQGHQEQPKKVLKTIIASIGLVGLLVSGMPMVSLDMMASLLMLGFAYKALEVIEKRDAMVVILTGFLLLGVLFIYSQSMLIALYSAFALAILTGALIAVQQDVIQDDKSGSTAISHQIAPNLKLSSLMLLLCLPLMLLFFIFSPRFAPLWTIPLSGGGHAKTGISDSMTPGDIANLSQSDELAFTVKFLGEKPSQNLLYWRGLVMQHFDGKTWTQFSDGLTPEASRRKLRTSQQSIRNRLLKKGYGRKYEVIYEKTARPWLFALTPVVDIQGDAIYGTDYTLMSRTDILEPKMLTLTSYPETLRDAKLNKDSLKPALQLPKKGNPQSRALAKRLFAKASSNHDYATMVMNRFKQQDYYYTLRPELLGETNTIDEFLINNKKGFCAHYAGSFVFMMRAAGIPARVVTGYQGGKWNQQGKFLSVHQYDAHAWTEVWFKDKGWVRFDPTAMVAPDRIEKNLEQAVDAEGSFLENQVFSMEKYIWLNALKSKMDSAQYAWRRFVIGYDSESQSTFLKQLFGELNLQKIALIVGGFFIGIIALWSLLLGLGRKQQLEAEEHQLYRKFCQRLEKYGIHKQPSQTPTEFSHYAAAQLPSLSHEIEAFSHYYSQLCYNPNKGEDEKSHLKTLKTLFKKIQKK